MSSTATAAADSSRACSTPDAIARLVADRADIDDADDILTKGDDDDNSGADDYTIKDYASAAVHLLHDRCEDRQLGGRHRAGPQVRHRVGPSGENLQSKYGGTDADEVDSGTGKYLVKTRDHGRLRQLRRRRRQRHPRVLLPAAGPRHGRQQ